MAGFLSWQMNQILHCDWLPEWARCSYLACLWLYAMSSKKFPENHVIHPACSVKMAWYLPCSFFFVSLWTSAILTSHLVNDPYLLVMTASLFFYVIFISTSCGWTLLWWPFIDLIFPDNFKEKRYPPGNSVSKGSWLEWSHGSCKENICGEWQW